MTEVLQSTAAPPPSTINAPAQSQTAEGRRADLEAARRAASAEQVARAEQAASRRSEQFEVTTEIIQRAIGANTRLEIEAGNGSNPFVYRAIDRDTGEIVSEWPPAQFAALIEKAASPGDAITGLIVNQES